MAIFVFVANYAAATRNLVHFFPDNPGLQRPYLPKISFFWSCGAAVRFFRMFFLAFQTLWRPSVLVLFPSCVDATHPWFGCDPVVRGSSELKPLRHRAPVLEFCWVGCLIFGSPDVLLLVAKSLALFG